MRERTHLQQLETIRSLATAGRYDEALVNVSKVLKHNPNDLEALRLRGNILELKVLDYGQFRPQKLMRSKEYLEARSCYEQILKVDPNNTLALIDMGDHFFNVDAYDRAEAYYVNALSLLRNGEFRLSWEDELREAFDRYMDLCEQRGDLHKKSKLQQERDKLIAHHS